MNKIKDYIKTLLKLAMQNNPEVLNVVRNAKVENDKWITVHPRGEDNKGRPLLLKDGENVYEAMQRQWGISSPGQQHLFSVSKYKTDDNYKKELDAKIAELNKQVEKSREEESKRKEERIQKDAEIMMLDKFLLKHRESSFGGDYFKATDFWEKHYKDYHTKAENGGSGSGNFDHDGRPGQVGGSLPYDSKLSDKQNEAFFKKWENAPEIKLKPSDWDNISDIKKLRQEVKKYLLSDMRKIPLHRKELGDIRFSGKSIDEFITYSADRDKLLAAKQLPQFIEEGKLGEYFDSPKDRSKQDTIKGFYPIYFNLKTSTDARKAEILIAKDDNGKLFFDMFLDYDRDKAQLKRALNGNLNPVALNNIITDNREDFNPSIQNEKWISIKKGDEVVHLPLDGNNKIDTKRIEQWKEAERGIKQELGDKVKKVEVEEPKDVDKKEKDFTVKKETQKAVLLSKDGVEFWTPKRFYKDGELTPAGKEIYENARSLKDTTDELEKNGVEFEPSWESEKAYGVDTYFEDYNGKIKPVRVFIPKSQIMKNGNIPLWLFKKKIEELNEKVGFAANKGDYGSGFKTNFYKGKIVTNSKETVYTILDGELYEFEAEDFNPDIKNNVQNNKEQDMTLLDELKKLITKVENDKAVCEQSAQSKMRAV